MLELAVWCVGYVGLCCSVVAMAPKRKNKRGGSSQAAESPAQAGSSQAASSQAASSQATDFRAKALALMCQQTRDMLCKKRSAGDEAVRDDAHEWLDCAWVPPQRVRHCDRAGCSAKGPSIQIFDADIPICVYMCLDFSAASVWARVSLGMSGPDRDRLRAGESERGRESVRERV